MIRVEADRQEMFGLPLLYLSLSLLWHVIVPTGWVISAHEG